jgi:hypothetical protein
VTAGLVLQSEVDAILTELENKRGQQVVLYDYFPALWKSQAKTYAQLKLEGWFPSPE